MDILSFYRSTCICEPSTILKIFILTLLSCIDLACGQRIITPPRDEVRTLGEDAEFHCLVEFGPIPTVAWEFNDAIIYSMETKGENYPAGNKKYLVTHDEGNFTLWVKDVDLKDGGKYTCSSMVPSASATLIVLDTPKIFTSRHDVEGQTAKYTCVGQFSGPSRETITSEQYPKLQMFFPGVPPKGIVKEGNCTRSSNCFEFTQVSTKMLEASDNGKNVMCRIGTSLVYLNSSTEMTVLYAVRNVAYTPKKEQYGVGTQINCTADGNPAPAFTWDDTVKGNSVDGQTLEITEQMLGNNTWKCTASNYIVEIQHRKSVSVVFEAVTRDITSKDSGNVSSKIGIVIGVTVPVCAIVILPTCYCLRRYRKPKIDHNYKRGYLEKRDDYRTDAKKGNSNVRDKRRAPSPFQNPKCNKERNDYKNVAEKREDNLKDDKRGPSPFPKPQHNKEMNDDENVAKKGNTKDDKRVPKPQQNKERNDHENVAEKGKDNTKDDKRGPPPLPKPQQNKERNDHENVAEKGKDNTKDDKRGPPPLPKPQHNKERNDHENVAEKGNDNTKDNKLGPPPLPKPKQKNERNDHENVAEKGKDTTKDDKSGPSPLPKLQHKDRDKRRRGADEVQPPDENAWKTTSGQQLVIQRKLSEDEQKVFLKKEGDYLITYVEEIYKLHFLAIDTIKNVLLGKKENLHINEEKFENISQLIRSLPRKEIIVDGETTTLKRNVVIN